MAKGNFIEYVVSDNPNKYPNNGEQDGYYYRKVTKVETEEKTVTPTTEDLIVTPVEGKYLNQVTVQGDANFLEENIAEGITIWGKTGTHQGSSVETCTLSITSGSFGVIYCTVYSNGNIEYKKVDVHSENVNRIDNIVVGSIVSLRVPGYESTVVPEPSTSSENFVYLAPGLFQITGDANSGTLACFVKGTKITTKHGAYKFVEDITYDDELLVWDFDNACFAYAKPCWIKKAETTNYYYQCTFENGDILKVVGSNGRSHRIFSFDDNKFLSATDCVGKMVMNKDGITKMLSCEKIEETVEFYNIITERHMNLFAENMLTSCRLNNLYPIQDMKFVKDDKLTIPIERYSSVTQKYYDSLRLGERDIEDIEWINSYVERIDSIAKAHNKYNL